MKHIWLLLSVFILGLSGCTLSHTETAKTFNSNTETAVTQNTAPAYPASLTEVVSDTVTVYIDGTQAEGLCVNNTVLMSCSALKELWSWLSWTAAEGSLSLTKQNGEQLTLPYSMVNGVDEMPDAYNGTDAVLFCEYTGECSDYWIPVAVIAEQLGMRALMDWEQNVLYLGQKLDKALIARGRSVPILMYHAVSDNCWGISDLFVSPASMREQLQYLKDNGYDPIFFSDLTHLEDYDKPILLTFDDGYDDNYTQLYPLLKEFQMKATIFIITGSLGTGNAGQQCYMTAAQARELSQSGLVSIQSHTVNHYELATLNCEQQTYELQQSQLDVARITGKIPYALSYPRGSHNGTTLELAPQYYDCAVIMNGNRWTSGGGFYEMKRHYVARSLGISGFAALIR